MLYSKIIHENTLYILLHAEQVYQNFHLFDENLGFFTSELTRETIERVGKEIKKVSGINSIIIDFFQLEENHNSFIELSNIVTHCIKSKIDISLIRINESLYNKINIHKFKTENYNLKESTTKICDRNYFNLFSKECICIKEFDKDIFNLYEKKLLEKDLYIEDQDKEKQYSESSNVILPKYLNIKRFIEDKEISFIGLYLLCKKTINEELIPDLRVDERPVIVFPSITASYLASIFAKLACCDIAYRDHIGPKNKIYRTIQKGIFMESKKHLIISDVICMGTEIQITKNIIEHEGAKIEGVLSIINVKVTDKTPNNNVISLIDLTKEKNKGINYKIQTNFQL
ncbi:hypothetical protein SDC9_15842 [bioreactor metagenome]|uniref:Uncharacterized protein n=1 Tax=bioreactor metagenome TaxID=1076179 RepID=A0A644TWL6_9ZZZZ